MMGWPQVSLCTLEEMVAKERCVVPNAIDLCVSETTCLDPGSRRVPPVPPLSFSQLHQCTQEVSRISLGADGSNLVKFTVQAHFFCRA